MDSTERMVLMMETSDGNKPVASGTFRRNATRRLRKAGRTARAWPYLFYTLLILGIITSVALLTGKGVVQGIGARVLVIAAIGAVVWLALRLYGKYLRLNMPPKPEGYEAYARPRHEHGDKVSDFTLRSGVLADDEVVLYDERPHWGHTVVSLFSHWPKFAIALVVVLVCLLSPWTSEVWMPLVKLGVLAAVGFWVIRQEIESIWMHYVVTNRRIHILVIPPAFIGGLEKYAIPNKGIQASQQKQSWLMRGFNMNNLALDTPSQKDERFSRLTWVKDPIRFMKAVGEGSL